jgi:hypothetical protein
MKEYLELNYNSRNKDRDIDCYIRHDMKKELLENLAKIHRKKVATISYACKSVRDFVEEGKNPE